MTGSVTGIRRRRTVAGRRETSHLPPDRAFYGQTLDIGKTGKIGHRYRAIDDISSGSILSILSRLSISTALDGAESVGDVENLV